MTIPKEITLEQALGKIPLGLFQWRLLVMCGGAFMADSIEVNLLTYLATCAGDDWNLDDVQKATITGTIFLGIVGTTLWGVFADWYGRRPIYFVACLVLSLFAFLSGAAPNFYALIIFRSITGFGLGAMDIPFDLLAEFMPLAQRGNFLIYIAYFWTIGSLLVTGLAWAFLSSHGWRLLVYVTAIPVTVISLSSLWYLPESPRWLLVKGKREQAEKVVRDAAAVNGVELEPFVLVQDKLPQDVSSSSNSSYANSHIMSDNTSSSSRSSSSSSGMVGGPSEDATYTELLQDASARKINIPLWVTWIMFGFSYYGIILFVGRLYEKDNHGSCSFNYSAIFYNAASEFVGCTFALLFIDSWGRRYTQSVFYAISALTVLLMGLETNAATILVFGILARLTVKTALSATWVVTPELYSTRLRTVGHSVSFGLSKVGAFGAPFLVTSQAPPVTVGIVLCISGLVAATSSMLLPETREIDLDALDAGSKTQPRRAADSAGAGDSESGNGVLLSMVPRSN